ncbi:cation-transporting P-type ATPase [Pelomyxa schiedti]|nr:cation-transporting P-type ATPase [Pelomyxa schiedti]
MRSILVDRLKMWFVVSGAGFLYIGHPVASRIKGSNCLLRNEKPSDHSLGFYATPPEGKAWNNISIADALKILESDKIVGLPHVDAMSRLAQCGPNVIFPEKKATTALSAFLLMFLKEVHEPTQILLLLVAVLYSLVGEVGEAIFALSIICLMMMCEALTEFRAKRAVQNLGKEEPQFATVIREGEMSRILQKQVVPGDLVCLQPGFSVPADAILLSSWDLVVDQSAITGDSVPESKHPIDSGSDTETNFVHASTTIFRGKGRALVVTTGSKTLVGSIAATVDDQHNRKQPQTPMQKQLKTLALILSGVALLSAILITVLGIVSHLYWKDILLTAFAILFATIPEELPILVVAVLAVGAQSLSRSQIYIKRVRAMESLAFVDTVLTDKTGTLTTNKLSLVRVILPEQSGGFHTIEMKLSTSGTGDSSDSQLDNQKVDSYSGPLHHLFSAWWHFVVDPSSTECQVWLDSFDTAVNNALRELQFPGKETLCKPISGSLTQESPFDPAKKITTREFHNDNQDITLYAKGAPEAVLEWCAIPKGEETAQLVEAVNASASQGERVVAFALKSSSVHPDKDLPPQIVGMFCFDDPLVPFAEQAVSQCIDGCVRVVMVTGDHPNTAGAVASKVGITGPVVNCGEKGSDSEWVSELVPNTGAFSRATPFNKLAIVERFQSNGNVVAVTGDGVNDAPALARADVSIAVANATDIAREASSMVVVEGGFPSVISAMREGRRLYNNLLMALVFYLGCKLGVIIMFVVGVLWQGFPLTPTQLILTELFMDIGASTSFVAESASGDVMKRPPARKTNMPLRGLAPCLRIIAIGLSLALCVLGGFTVGFLSDHGTNTGSMSSSSSSISSLWRLSSFSFTSASSSINAGQPELSISKAQSMAFACWLSGHFLLAFNSRTDTLPLLRHPTCLWSNKIILAWGAGVVLAGILIGTVPWVQTAIGFTQLGAAGWITSLVIAATTTCWMEIAKWAHFVSPRLAMHTSRYNRYRPFTTTPLEMQSLGA